MARELSIKLAERTPDGIYIFTVAGALGVEGSAGIQGLLDACLKEQVRHIILDLGEVNFVSSAGMGAFLSAVGELRKQAGDIIFSRMQDKIMTVFRTLDVLDYFIVADTVDQAVERFRAGTLPRPPSLEELTAGAAEKPPAAEPDSTPALFSLLAAYSDILGAEAEISHQLTQIVDVTANYLALEQCALVPLSETLALNSTAARGTVPAPPAAVKTTLGEALREKEFAAVDQLPGLTKELAAWAAAGRARFLLPVGRDDVPLAVLAVGEKKDGTSLSQEEQRLLRYLRTALTLAFDNRFLRRRLLGDSPGDKRQISRMIMEIETLFSVSEALAEALETDKMLPTFLMMITGQFGTDRAAILLPGADGGFMVRAARGLDDEILPSLDLPPDGLAEVVGAQTGPAVMSVLALTLDDAHRGQIKPFVDQGLAVAAPMRFKNEIIGIVFLGAKISGRDFGPEELRLLDALVKLAGVSVETATLLDTTKKNYGGLVRALISAVEAKDEFTRGHTERVTLYAAALADEVGLEESYRQDLLFAAVLHDVGYLGIPEEILRVTDGITEEQLAELRRHPEIGADILQGIPFLRKALAGIRHHHEWYDGSGYPDGLAGDDIPQLARLIAVADSFDAMTTDRRYREAKSKEEALAEIAAHRGAQFDPTVVDAFENLVTDGRLEIITPKRYKPEG
ncbi:MAG: HD domain-containing protein [Candidatus Coatesbacteria bacterium]|nr:MAG: HD domain-containing protein [Candidatus Coatesbacteria bacterium]